MRVISISVLFSNFIVVKTNLLLIAFKKYAGF